MLELGVEIPPWNISSRGNVHADVRLFPRFPPCPVEVRPERRTRTRLMRGTLYGADEESCLENQIHSTDVVMLPRVLVWVMLPRVRPLVS